MRIRETIRTRPMRLAAKIALAIVLLYGLLGFIAVPLIVYHVVSPRLATRLGRPVSVARFRFNPYQLKVDIRGLHLGDREAGAKFVDIGHLSVKASWTSIFRFAPVVGELTIEQPSIHLVRNTDGGFNFSDLLETKGAPTAKPNAASSPMRFAVSNIQLRDGEIRLDDRMLGKQHAIEKIQLGVPFVANLPADVDIYVQPLLQMVVDGSPLRLTGQSKPFQATRESEIDLRLHQLDLPLYLGYVPKKLPVQVAGGKLSCNLQVHFVNAGEAPVIKVSGEAALDKIVARDRSNAPLAELAHAAVTMTDVEPLTGVAHLGRIYVGGLTSHLVINADGGNNLTTALNGNAANVGAQAGKVSNQAASPPASSPTPLAQSTPVQAPITAAAIEPIKLPDVSVESFELANSAIDLIDNSGATPAKAAIHAIHAGMKGLKLNAQPPAPFDMTAKLGGGGTIAVKGALDFAGSRATTQLSIEQVDLPALQNFAQSVLAATIASGKMSAQATIKTDFGAGKFNLHAEPAQISLDNFVLNAAGEKESPLQWKRVSASIGQVDLGAHQATVTQVLVDGLRVNARRERDGKLSLLALLASTRSSAPAPPSPQNRIKHQGSSQRSARAAAGSRARHPKPATPPPAVLAAHPGPQPVEQWKYQIASVVIENLQANVEDRTTAQPVKLALAPLNLSLKNVTSDFSKPFPLALDATINRTGTVKVVGTAAVSPLKAEVKISTKRVGLAFADPLVSAHLNTTISNAELTMDGAVGAENRRDKFLVSYRGDATLGRVKLLDKQTGDDFVRWNALSLKRLDVKIGEDTPKINVGAIALDDFYARIILDSTGKLNFKDIRSTPESAPKSLTRANPDAGVAPPQISTAIPSAAPTPAAGSPVANVPAQTAAQPLGADVELGQITLHGGHVNYSDNFIKPNYTADLTDVTGKIGAFGTAATSPADVLLEGQVNGSSPINISGAINPLAPAAFVDIKAKADGIELSPLTPYSTRYTGYPIVKGTLTVDVHYLLDAGKLTADNHIFIDQLTFGDKVESRDATNLPIRLAVSLLKNSRGEIDLRVPVSGSLSDPQFSIGGVIWHVLANLIMKAVTSPFSLIAAAMGGSGGEELGYVEFVPGFATLTPESQKKLDSVAAVLQQRGSLKLGIHGRVDPEVDRDGLRDAAVMHAIQAQKVEGKEGVELDAVEIKPDEYDKYLGRAYRAAKFPKPANFVGLNKSLPPAEMKKLMIANAQVSDADLPKLAEARAAAVRKYLSTKIEPSRLFVAAPTLNAQGIQDKGKTSRVDLSLD